jgi:transcriptional regulator with XRE-family HTH domain
MAKSHTSVRCQNCHLPQPLTETEICRGCKKPLTLAKFLDIEFPIWRSDGKKGRVIREITASAAPRTRGNFSKQLGSHLKKLREERGLSRVSLRHVASTGSFCRFERGDYYPSIETLEELSEAYDVPIWALLSMVPIEHSILDDPFVGEFASYLRTLSWSRWLEVVIMLKKMTMPLPGAESLRLRAELEREVRVA